MLPCGNKKIQKILKIELRETETFLTGYMLFHSYATCLWRKKRNTICWHLWNYLQRTSTLSTSYSLTDHVRLTKQYRITKNHFSQKMTQHASLHMFIAISYHRCQNVQKNDEEKKGKSLCCRTATVERKGLTVNTKKRNQLYKMKTALIRYKKTLF